MSCQCVCLNVFRTVELQFKAYQYLFCRNLLASAKAFPLMTAKYRGAEMFAFVFEAALFVFELDAPAFVPLFALPPARRTTASGNSLLRHSEHRKDTQKTFATAKK